MVLNVYKVPDSARINPLSLIYAPNEIIIVFNDGRTSRLYDKIHWPLSYLNSIKDKSNILGAYINGKKYIKTIK